VLQRRRNQRRRRPLARAAPFRSPVFGALEPPYPLPISTRWDTQCDHVSEELGRGVLERETDEILSSEYAIDATSVELVSRIHPVTCKSRPTILIVAPWHASPSPWERAVERVKRFVDTKRLTSQRLSDFDIAVEMVAEDLTVKKYLSVVPSEILDRGLDRNWGVIRDKILDILESHPGTEGHVTTIDLFRLGSSPCDAENPITSRDPSIAREGFGAA
jgi:hypothetical protein